ncbi:hypothetical protein GCM10009827_094120 [Dactylosporangium maewongense]|uniref:Uncharacterized protein n=1 Tax=Dactylosporangium maewongense TaxID=634393 RepID=A0ABP4N9T8_9ACTN
MVVRQARWPGLNIGYEAVDRHAAGELPELRHVLVVGDGPAPESTESFAAAIGAAADWLCTAGAA